MTDNTTPDPDPWAEIGYADGPGDPVRCPWCDHTGSHDLNTGPLGGIICGSCGNLFTSRPGEHASMGDRRRMWAEETKDHDP